jgi:hypothetical protein
VLRVLVGFALIVEAVAIRAAIERSLRRRGRPTRPPRIGVRVGAIAARVSGAPLARAGVARLVMKVSDASCGSA